MKNVYNLRNKTVLHLICNRINGFVGDIADKLLGKMQMALLSVTHYLN